MTAPDPPPRNPLRRAYNQLAGNSVERIGALSDGVFAIAVTLIVLEVHVPEAHGILRERELLAALAELGPRFLMYGMSFLTLGIFWVGQQTQLSRLDRADRDLTWIHIAFLAAVAVVPFTTALLAEFITFRTALVIYWLNIVVLGLALLGSWTYAARAGLLAEGAEADIGKAVVRRIVIGQALYAIGAALCVIDTKWSIAFIFAVQMNYAIAPRLPILRSL